MIMHDDKIRRLRSTRGRLLIAAAITGSVVVAMLIALGGAVYAVAYVAALPPRRLARAGRRRASGLRPVRAARRVVVASGARTLTSILVAGAIVAAGATT